jgi:hypothetical protein
VSAVVVSEAPESSVGAASERGILAVKPDAVRAVVKGAVRSVRHTVGEPQVSVETKNETLVISVNMSIVYPNEPIGIVLDEIRSEIVPMVERQLGRAVQRLDITVDRLVSDVRSQRPRVQ